MKVKVRGRYWNLLFTDQGLAEGQQGECQAPHLRGKTIKVRPDMSPLEELDTTIHELLHAGLWDLDEEVVEELASDLARILRKLGYRRVDL